MTLDGDIDEVPEQLGNRRSVEILEKVRSFIKQNRAFIYALWDCNNDYDIKDFLNDMKPYDSSTSDILDTTREKSDGNEYE